MSEGVRAGGPPLNIAARGARLHYSTLQIKGFVRQSAYFSINVATIYGNAANAMITTLWPVTIEIEAFSEKNMEALTRGYG